MNFSCQICICSLLQKSTLEDIFRRRYKSLTQRISFASVTKVYLREYLSQDTLHTPRQKKRKKQQCLHSSQKYKSIHAPIITEQWRPSKRLLRKLTPPNDSPVSIECYRSAWQDITNARPSRSIDPTCQDKGQLRVHVKPLCRVYGYFTLISIRSN